MANQSNAQNFDYLVKLLLLGESAVGKSSLLTRFCDDKFDSHHVLTIGVDFKWKLSDRNGKTVKIQVWDTAGQERFRTITPTYYKSTHGVGIVYDITDRDTFVNVSYWVEQLSQHGPDGVPRILVGNKADLDDEGLRKVSKSEGEELAKKHGLAFFETSAKTGQGVEDALITMADQGLEFCLKTNPDAARGGGAGKIDLNKAGKEKKKGCNC
eukprot:TRINITY_DN19993_c0_g1_i1.p1 TRINITY_DN19993_c0_g1~~TRINITY_DN19993_c0_g1_i1.p1  ORF type:complete len:212 (-),score=41.48 TRINITY_DN19993_c0_g1_i1:158-793(-)